MSLLSVNLKSLNQQCPVHLPRFLLTQKIIVPILFSVLINRSFTMRAQTRSRVPVSRFGCFPPGLFTVKLQSSRSIWAQLKVLGSPSTYTSAGSGQFVSAASYFGLLPGQSFELTVSSRCRQPGVETTGEPATADRSDVLSSEVSRSMHRLHDDSAETDSPPRLVSTSDGGPVFSNS
jgi:hypothetical protein